MLSLIPSVATVSIVSVSRAISSAGLISYATPSAGIGLIRLATHVARRAGSFLGGISPMWLLIRSNCQGIRSN